MAEAKGMTLADWFDDLTVRFLLNLPPSELSSIPRLCFQVEEAQWYYEDFIRPLAAAEGKPLPGLPLRAFCLALFQHCPLLSGFTDTQHIAAYEEFLAYKVRVPVRGAILLDESMERVLLVRGWKKGASWSFPRGKINKDEKDLDCAVREVYEETGFDIREADLVPENEKEAKHIDITMREQHMRMFVFRDVPLETHFEPKTRKEIGKIAWYNLRDLPGFAKKNRHDGEGGNANKFYMVAPFIGHLKKWIAQQRRKDAAVVQTEEQLALNGLPVHQEVSEEYESGQAQSSGPMPNVDRSEELKRLLSIGGPAPAVVQQPAPAQQQAQPTDLLAILQGSSRAPPPQTPLEQINAFPQQPETPQPHHPRQPSMGYNQPPPQFPFSPPRMQQQQMQQHQHVSFPNMHGMRNQPVHPGMQPQNGIPPHIQQQMQTFQPQQRPIQPSLPLGMPHPHANGFAHAPQSQQYQLQPPQLYPQVQPQMQQPQQYQFPPKGPEGAHGAIAAGPAVPAASQLPAPKLTAQAQSLLSAFKSGARPTQPVPSSQKGQRQTSVHQAKLLGLFKSPVPSSAQPAAPGIPQAPVAAETTAPVSVQPVKNASVKDDRRPTLNEITRTLSGPFKPKRPSQPSPVQPQEVAPPPLQVADSTDELSEQYEPTRPIRQPRGPPELSLQQQRAFSPKFAPPQSPAPLRSPTRADRPARTKSPLPLRPDARSTPASPAPPKSPAPTKQNPRPEPQKVILQRREQPAQRELTPARTSRGASSSSPAPSAAKHQSRTPTSQSPARPARQSKQKTPTVSGSRTPTAPFTILTRPGSEKSAVAEEAPKQPFQPQLLKRPDDSEVDKASKPALEQPANGSSDGIANGTEKRDHLLALFGKPSPQPPAKSPSPTIMVASSPLASPPAAQNNGKSNLLNLFTSEALPRQRSPQPPTPVQQQRPEPPRAPSLQPVPHTTPTPTQAPPPHQAPPRAAGAASQNALLDLFKKPTHPASASVTSPVAETPISPFTLGSPNVGRLPLRGAEQPRSRLGSVASSDVGNGSRRGSGVQTPTPTEAKDFLLGFLNGVVQKEGAGGRK